MDRAAVDDLIRAALKAWQVPGAAVAIVRDDEVVYLQGHGVRQLGVDRPVTPDTLFPLASCTKGFTTTAMAILVDEGRMHWDDRVRQHLPWFHLSDPHVDADVRLRDLVTHRTGVGAHDLLWYHAPWPQEEIIRRVGRLPLDKPFRTTFQYQSTMFTAAGHAVAAASGTSWADFVRKRILDPLGMKHAVLTGSAAEKSDDRAFPHRKNRAGTVDVIPFYPMAVPDPAGSLHASAADLTRWLRFHLGGGTFEGKEIVSAGSLRETHTPQIVLRLEGSTRAMNPETNLMSYGMGWLVRDYRGRQIVEHAGLIDGFRAHLTLLPKEKIGIALLCNLHETRMNLALSNSLIDLLLGLPRRDWNATLGEVTRQDEKAAKARFEERQARRKPESAPSLELKAYAGTYEEPAYGTARVAVETGKLVLRWSSFVVTLDHFADDTFLAPDDRLFDPLLTFVVKERRVASMKAGEPLGVEFKKQ